VARSKTARIAAGLAISVGLLLLALNWIDITKLAHTLESASVFWICLGSALYWLELMVRVQRWSVILTPVCKLPFSRVATALIIGYAANNALPARLGELVRADFVARRHGASRFSVVGTIIVERLSDMVAVIACAAVGMLYTIHDRLSLAPELLTAVGIAAVAVAVAGVGIFVLSRSAKPLLDRFPRLSWMLSSILLGFRSIHTARQLTAVAALSTLVWLCNGMALWAVLNAIGIVEQWTVILLLIGTSGLAAAIPSAPANIGTLQFAFISVLVAVGYSATDGFAAALLVQMFLLGSVTIGGAVLYAAWSLRRTAERPRSDAAV
jgi:glycosyltransferase 2 family protein